MATSGHGHAVGCGTPGFSRPGPRRVVAGVSSTRGPAQHWLSMAHLRYSRVPEGGLCWEDGQRVVLQGGRLPVSFSEHRTLTECSMSRTRYG